MYDKGIDKILLVMEIIKIDPRLCTRWKYADRNSFEFGDINLLAEDIKLNGQINPIYVRPIKDDSKFKYEVIVATTIESHENCDTNFAREFFSEKSVIFWNLFQPKTLGCATHGRRR